MSSTNYYTVDAEIAGEYSSGSTVNYLADALGSVTLVNTGNKNATASYTPYGRGASPEGASFGWVGAHGYRPTGRLESTHYVRARHESATRGRWISVDHFWPDQPSFAYAMVNPLTRVDRLGLAPMACNFICDDDDDPCAWANAHLDLIGLGSDADKVGGFVLCCDGRAVPCLVEKKRTHYPDLDDCVRAHEKWHIEHPGPKQTCRKGYIGVQKGCSDAIECRAHETDIVCLEGANCHGHLICDEMRQKRLCAQCDFYLTTCARAGLRPNQKVFDICMSWCYGG
jgi:hypothetical protein